MENGINLDLTEDIRSLIEPLVADVDNVKIIRTDKEENLYRREQTYLIVCNKEDLGKLIGRHGVISDSLRTILNVSTKNLRKKIHLRFMSNEEYKQKIAQ